MAPRGVRAFGRSCVPTPFLIGTISFRYESRFIGSESRRVKINRGALGEEAALRVEDETLVPEVPAGSAIAG